MPARRGQIRRNEHAITPEAVGAYRRDDYLALHRALGLKVWETSPLWADRDEPGWGAGTAGNMSWPQARELRAQLEAAVTGEDIDDA